MKKLHLSVVAESQIAILKLFKPTVTWKSLLYAISIKRKLIKRLKGPVPGRLRIYLTSTVLISCPF